MQRRRQKLPEWLPFYVSPWAAMLAPWNASFVLVAPPRRCLCRACELSQQDFFEREVEHPSPARSAAKTCVWLLSDEMIGAVVSSRKR